VPMHINKKNNNNPLMKHIHFISLSLSRFYFLLFIASNFACAK
jgi:hypothetical protein